MATGCSDWSGGDVRVWQCLQNDAVGGGKYNLYSFCLSLWHITVCMYVCTLEMHPISIFAVPLHIYTYMYIVPYGVQM